MDNRFSEHTRENISQRFSEIENNHENHCLPSHIYEFQLQEVCEFCSGVRPDDNLTASLAAARLSGE